MLELVGWLILEKAKVENAHEKPTSLNCKYIYSLIVFYMSIKLYTTLEKCLFVASLNFN